MSLKKAALKGLKITTFSSIIVAVFQVLMMFFLVRVLEKSDFGLMAIVMVVKGLADLFVDFGISIAIIHKQNITTSQYSSLYWFGFLVSIVIYFIVFLITPLITSFYGFEELNNLLPIMCLAIPIAAIGTQQKTMLQKELHFKEIAITDVFSTFLLLISSVAFAYSGYGVYSIVFSNIIKYLVSNIIFLWIGYRIHPIKLHFSFKEIRSFLKIGYYKVVGQSLNYFSTNFDILIIGKLLGDEKLGLYNLAKDLVLKPASLLNPIVSRVFAPLFAKIQDNKDKFNENFILLQKNISYLSAYIYLFIAALSYPIVYLYYGEQYLETAILVTILAIFYYIREYSLPFSIIIVAKGRTDVDMRWNIIAFFLNPLVVYVSASISIQAVAIALLLTTFIYSYPSWLVCVKPVLGESFIYYFNNLIKTSLIFVLPFIITAISIHLMNLSPIAEFITGAMIFSILAFLFVLLRDKNYFSTLKQMATGH